VEAPTTAAAVRDALAKLFADACAGRVEPKVAQVAASLSGDLLKAIQAVAYSGPHVPPIQADPPASEPAAVTYGVLSPNDWESLFGFSDFQEASTPPATPNREEAAPNPTPVPASERATAAEEHTDDSSEVNAEQEDLDQFLEWYRKRHPPVGV
jgi:hypothetical protein